MGIVAKYKFDGSVYADLIPKFNAEFTDYNITDEVDSENSNHIIRTIESDSLPTLMRFGCDDSNTKTSREESLLEVLDLNTSNLNTMLRMFMYCSNLKFLPPFSDIGTTTSLMYMCYGCSSLTELNLANVKFNDGMVLHQICMDCSSLINLELPIENFYVSDMLSMMSNCTSLKFLNLSNLILSSSDANCSSFINNCWELTTLDISNLNTNQSVITGDCRKLKYVKCNIPLTIQTISSQLPTRTSDDPGTIIYQGAETLPSEVITELNSKGWNVVTSPQLIAKYKYDSKIYKNLIPVFNYGYMGFVEDEEVDENGIVTRKIEHVELPTYMRFGETWETTQNNPSWRSSSLRELLQVNDSNISIFDSMFKCCNNLRNVCKLNLNSTALTNVFYGCYNLEKLDLSNNTFSNAENISYLFSECAKLISLDISNVNLNKCRNFDAAFSNTSIADIGMIYCDQFTINKIASLLPTNHNITIWVESDDILQYDQYDHITYKTQKVQDTVHLNSPLLMGDTIEVIDGKTYHVHRWEKIVLDGSEGIDKYYLQDERDSTLRFNISNILINSGINWGLALTNTLPYLKCTEGDIEGCQILGGVTGKVISIGILRNKLSTPDVNGFKQWLSENPTTVIYKLANPYYELISEDPLELTLLDTTDNTINNNSILPSNMTIANKELSTIAIKPSTIYTLSFDKSNVDSEVTIDICGGEQLTTVLNRIELTTPSELGSGIRFISSDGCIISNVRLLEGSLVESAIPKETFEGLKNSFGDGYLIGENLLGSSPYEQTLDLRILYKLTNEDSNLYTIYNGTNKIIYFDTLYKETGNYATSLFINPESIHRITLADNLKFRFINAHVNEGWKCTDDDVEYINNNVVVLEGDHTHLSEAELMRYIEKGTSHYEEEDYNHVGKYKVQYKVTGKNKFDKNKELQAINYNFNSENHRVDFNDDYIKVKYGLYGGAVYLGSIGSFKKGTYTISCECYSETLSTPDIHIGYFVNDNWKHRQLYQINFNTWEKFKYTFTLENDTDSLYLQFQASGSVSKYENIDFRVRNIQLEEGTVATEYEPYKEDIRTYYLSSPLLEGDTIEDVNGVATHVKRYGKVVLDGSESWNQSTREYTTVVAFYMKLNGYIGSIPLISDKFIQNAFPIDSEGITNNYNSSVIGIPISNTDIIRIKINKSKFSTLDVDGFKQWLQANPTTLVYQLASPIYEPISTESILLDSYTNGHLDLSNENIPIQKTEFRNFTKELAYLQPSTDYVVRFSSDNIGIAKVYLDSSVKEINVAQGINEVMITTPSTIVNNNIIIDGIGFNVSDVQVVANAIKDGDIKDFDYFKGLQSSFEDGLVTDENDENYGKYKVECKIVGKNKFNINSDFTIIKGKLPDSMTWEVSGNNLTVMNSYYDRDFNIYGILVSVKPYTDYYLTYINNSAENLDTSHRPVIHIYNQDGVMLHGWNQLHGGYKINSLNNKLIYVRINSNGWGNLVKLSDIQLEEGTKATSYEPYKESIHTLYLNSPLLKGDKLVVHEGKLCHYHKMGMVVLDGNNILPSNTNVSNGFLRVYMYKLDKKALYPGLNEYPNCYSNQLQTLTRNFWANFNIESVSISDAGQLTFSKKNDTLESFKQWLSKNPTTVVYELAEPYYEPIEPQLSQYSFSTVKDGNMEIITVLPIEKINLTYRTDINGVSSIEEQIASIQEGTDISSIIDEEVDE